MAIFPTVNMNGTHADDLIQQRAEVLKKLKEAIKAMDDAFPHGRDYPNMDATRQAQAQAEACIGVLRAMIEVVAAEIDDLYEQKWVRERRFPVH
jgi:hypothetical protein